jgi:hypothetical protein
VLQAKKHGPHKAVFFPDGQRYNGEWKDDLRHGKGCQYYKSGAKYEGDWAHDMRHGLGVLWAYQDCRYKVRYRGEWQEGIPSGMGTHYDDDGNMYEGEWLQGQKHGLGKMTYGSATTGPTGDVYEGEWQENVRHGKGTMTFQNNDVYEGHFVAGVRCGMGTMFFMAKGLRFDGLWEDDKPKSGNYTEIDAVSAGAPGAFPVLELAEPNKVLQEAMQGDLGRQQA